MTAYRRGLSPPGRRVDEGRGPYQEHPANVEEVATQPLITNSSTIVAPVRQCDSDTYVTQLRRRRKASQRLVPLDCGCVDPWPCRCVEPPLSDRQVLGAVAAAHHLRERDLTPIFDVDTLRAMWRAGHHQLVDQLRPIP